MPPRCTATRPITFVLGCRPVIAGWDQGIALMHKGDRAELLFLRQAGKLAIAAIPANSVLRFEVELVDVPL